MMRGCKIMNEVSEILRNRLIEREKNLRDLVDKLCLKKNTKPSKEDIDFVILTILKKDLLNAYFNSFYNI